jgi:hypothetical protein
MAGGKHTPEGKSKPSCKLAAIGLEMKIRMIHNYEGGQSLSVIGHEIGFGHERCCLHKRTCELCLSFDTYMYVC